MTDFDTQKHFNQMTENIKTFNAAVEASKKVESLPVTDVYYAVNNDVGVLYKLDNDNKKSLKKFQTFGTQIVSVKEIKNVSEKVSLAELKHELRKAGLFSLVERMDKQGVEGIL